MAWPRYKLKRKVTDRAPNEQSQLPWLQREVHPLLQEVRDVLNWCAKYVGLVQVDDDQTPVDLSTALAAGTGVTITKTGSSPDKKLTIAASALPAPYDLAPFYSGLLPSNRTLFHFEMKRTVTYAVAAGNFEGFVAVAPLADATITVKKNGVSVGTITIAAGTTTVVNNVAADIACVDGDYLDFVNQAVADAQLEGFGFTWKGTI